MRSPGRRTVKVYRKGGRDRNGDPVGSSLVGTYTGVSVQMTATIRETLDGRAERAVSNWTLVMPEHADVRAGDALVVPGYNGRELRLATDGHPHRPQFRSGRESNLIVRAREVDTV